MDRAAPLPTSGFEICTSGVARELPNSGLLRPAGFPFTAFVYRVLFSKLKTSTRNCALNRSENRTSLVTEKSHSFRPRPRNRLRGMFPYVPIAGGRSMDPLNAQQPYLASELT